MFRTVFYFFFAFALSFSAQGQQVGPPKLVWKVNRIDLGTLLEEQGKQTVAFEFTVSQGSSFFIQEVAPDCGCTTVAFSKDTLILGQSGKVQVEFDPSSAAGFFSKLLLVKGSQGQVQDSLYIEGIAVPYPTQLERNYPVKAGVLGLRMKKVSMGEVFDNEPKVKYLEFFNYAASPLEKINFRYRGPGYIRVEQVQERVRPQERGLLKITYEGALRTELGAVVDKIGIGWENEKASILELEVLADLFDYFAPISKDKLEEAAQLFIEQKVIDLGEINATSLQRKKLALSNLGKEDLEIRKIQGNCSCLTYELLKMVLAPGEKIELSLVFDPIGRKGIDQRNVYLFTNDPVNPVQLLVLKSRIK